MVRRQRQVSDLELCDKRACVYVTCNNVQMLLAAQLIHCLVHSAAIDLKIPPRPHTRIKNLIIFKYPSN